VTIPEDVPVGTAILTPVSTDRDDSINRELSFAITAGNDQVLKRLNYLVPIHAYASFICVRFENGLIKRRKRKRRFQEVVIGFSPTCTLKLSFIVLPNTRSDLVISSF